MPAQARHLTTNLTTTGTGSGCWRQAAALAAILRPALEETRQFLPQTACKTTRAVSMKICHMVVQLAQRTKFELMIISNDHHN